MTFTEATADYERWLRRQCNLYEPDWAYKSKALAKSPFHFVRGTYYRWAQVWSTLAPELADAPSVLGVGDLHVENFGTWRDADGRLVWGINDFDDADEVPYTGDLLRLAVSLRLADWPAVVEMKFAKACHWILDGYRAGWDTGGEPFVLEESHAELRALAMAEEREPSKFWKKHTGTEDLPAVDPPAGVRRALGETLPAGSTAIEYRRREKAGVGSLGKPRYLALARWAGSWIAREAKAVTPPATAWLRGRETPSRIPELLARAVRCPDPVYRIARDWLVRRLAPRTSRIDLADLTRLPDVHALVAAMGRESANVHLGTSGARAEILADLDRRPDGWLANAAESTANAIQREWSDWARSIR